MNPHSALVKIAGRIASTVLLAIICMLPLGCKRFGPDVRADVSNVVPLKPGAPIIWQGQKVGVISKVTEHKGRQQLECEFAKEVKNLPRKGASAKAAIFGGLALGFTPHLRVSGGDDQKGQAIERGETLPETPDSLPEALFARTKGMSVPLIFVGVVVAGIVLMAMLKGLVKAGLVLGGGAFAVIIVLKVCQPDGATTQPIAILDSQTWRAQFEKQVKSPEARRKLAEIASQMDTILAQARTKGTENVRAAAGLVDETLNQIVSELKANKQEAAAMEVAKIQQKLREAE